MGNVKIRYYSVKHGRGYWQSTKVMQTAGFPASISCGKDGPAAWNTANLWNEKWDRHRFGIETGPVEPPSPPGSLSDAFQRFRRLDAWNGKAAKTKAEWERAWLDIQPIFGDVNPNTVTIEHIDQWYSALLKTTTLDRAWRAMKIWRALWNVAAAMHYCLKDADPSQGVRRLAQKKRDKRWSEGEVVRLVKAAIRKDLLGLACIVAVAWDSQMSPGDVRTLTPSQRRERLFTTARAKTGKAALGTISRRTERLINAYIEALASAGVIIAPDAPLFRGAKRLNAWSPYEDDTLSKAFRRLRESVFPGDTRTIMDMRRSGAVEAVVGGVDTGHLAAKMANSIDTATALQATYIPVDPVAVRLADDARRIGRERLRKALKKG